MINDRVREELRKNGVDEKDGIGILLLIKFNIYPTSKNITVDEDCLLAVLATPIITLDSKSGKYVWSIPLFEEDKDIDSDKWEWVDEYTKLFKDRGKLPFKRECTKRMKKLFSENPEIRVDDVLEATKAYLATVSEDKYVMNPHYFIKKGIGSDSAETILQFIDVIRAKDSVDYDIRD